MSENKVLFSKVINNMLIELKESSEDPPQGLILDIFDTDTVDKEPELIESYTLWFDEYVRGGY